MLTFLLTLLKNLVPIKDLVEVVVGNRRERDQQISDEQGQLWKEFGNEWSYKAVNRNAFDRFMDALNRTPRPLFVLHILALFWYAVLVPSSFVATMQALALIPSPLWAALSVILAFFFGGRMISRDFKITKEDRAALGTAATRNPSIEAWRKSKQR